MICTNTEPSDPNEKKQQKSVKGISTRIQLPLNNESLNIAT